MQRVRLILSFDHELSLGGTESYRYNLFDPTEALIALADELDVPIALFTDVLCAERYREWDREGFFTPYGRQLGSALSSGHDVQLHIHPHWVTSTFRDGVYCPSSQFALSDFELADPPNDIPGIVGRAYDLLTEICKSYDANYRCVAYRAGGHNLYPATARILTALYDKGIRIDSSVVKNFRFRSGISTVDLTGMPKAANWTVPLRGPITAAADNGIYEIPVAGSPRTPFNNVPFLINRVLRRNRAHDPRGPSIHAAHTPIIQKLGRMFPQSAWALSFDDAAHSVGDLIGILRSHLRAHANSAEVVCAAVSHPKSMGDYERSLMSGFVRRARALYGEALEFTTYRAIFEERLSAHDGGPNGPFHAGDELASVIDDGEAGSSRSKARRGRLGSRGESAPSGVSDVGTHAPG